MSRRLKSAISRTVAVGIIVVIVVAVIAGAWILTQQAPPREIATPTTSPSPTTPSPSPSPTETTPTTTPTVTSPSPTPTETTPTETTPPAPTKGFHKRIIYVINDDAIARINLFQTGTADFAAIPLERIKDVEGLTLDGFETVVETGIPQPSMVFLVLNVQREPLNNELVRKALAWSVPYDQIIQTVYQGHLIRNYAIIPIGWPGYTEFGIEKFEYNLAKAKELLEKSGIDPTKYKIGVMYNAGNTQRERMATLLQNTWGQLGFQVEIEAYEWPVVLDKGEHGDFYVWIIGWVPDYLDSDNWVGPMFYGATKFTSITVKADASKSDIPAMLKTAKVIETDTGVVVVGEKGSGASAEIPSGKPIIIVAYEVDEEATKPVEYYMEQGLGFGPINPSFIRDHDVDALVIAVRQETNAAIRTELFKALYIMFNDMLPIIIIGQYELVRPYWNWVKGRYWHPTFPERFDLLWEDLNAPSIEIGIKDYKNDPETLVITTHGWPESFDPAMTYETFGWQIWHQVGDTLVCYWKEETEEVTPDLAVAWAHDEEGDDWYFVIRGGVVAYDPWNDKTYPIDAVDVAFTFWRVERLGHSVSWMVSEFMDVNASEVLTEEEFDQLLKSTPLKADYRGKSIMVSSLDELLEFYGYAGETAGVYHLKLKAPYAPILGILADSFLSILPMEYLLGDKYQEALEASNYGKNPEAWTKYVEYGLGEEEPSHQLMHKKPVGTGPYYVKEYEEGSYIVLEVNPYYWNATLWEELYSYKP